MNPTTSLPGNLIIIRGIPGSGKSTLARSLSNMHPICVHVEADQFMVNEHGEYNYNRDNLSHAHNQCYEHTVKFLAEGKTVIVANTFTRKWEMQRYLELVTAHTTVIIANGSYANVHGVPAQVVQQMKDRFEF